MANLGTAVSLLLPADAVWRGASYHLMPTNLLSPARWLATATPGCRSRPPTPMALAMLTWTLLYPAGCILSVPDIRTRSLSCEFVGGAIWPR